MRKFALAVIAATIGAAVFVPQAGSLANDGTEILSVSPDGTTAGNGPNEVPNAAALASVVSFTSFATNLVNGFVDGNDVNDGDVYLRDGATTTLVSHAANSSTTSADAESSSSRPSADGSAVIFGSAATNLISGMAGGGSSNTYRWDPATNTNVLVSHAAGSAVTGGDAFSGNARANLDASKIVFTSGATNLVSGFVDNNAAGNDVYLYDHATSVVTLLSGANGSATQGSDGAASAPSISSDGRTVSFVSRATDLIPGFTDGNGGREDVFVKDLETGSVTLVSHAPGSSTTGVNDEARRAVMSLDGSVIAFTSEATDVLSNFTSPGGANTTNVYLWDLATDETTLLSAASDSTAAAPKGGDDGSAVGDNPSVSLFGLIVAFESTATNLITGFGDNTGGDFNVFVYDRVAGATRLISHAAGSTTESANAPSSFPFVSADGQIVAYQSEATDLIDGFVDGNGAGVDDAYSTLLGCEETTLLSAKAGSPTTGGNGLATVQGNLSGDGRVVPFLSSATDLTTGVSYGADPFNLFTSELRLPSGDGYWLDASDGGIFSFGDAQFYGSTGDIVLNKPAVGMAATPNGRGYWIVASDGGIFSYGDATFEGSTGAITLNKPVVGMTAFPSLCEGEMGYWFVASDGGIFSYGAAEFHGSTGAMTLNQPIVGMAATPTGDGYWLVASDGGIFSFGDAEFFGSTGAMTLNKPIVGMAATPTGLGYWLVASDGGIFSFGDAEFFGSTGAITLNKPVVGMSSTITGGGYWFVASDGGIFSFGDAEFFGSTGAITLNKPVVGMTHT